MLSLYHCLLLLNLREQNKYKKITQLAMSFYKDFFCLKKSFTLEKFLFLESRILYIFLAF